MKKRRMVLLFIILTIMLSGCDKKMTEKDLIGEKWVATAGFKDKKIAGKPLCPYYEKGLTFIGEDVVTGDAFDEEFKYALRETDGVKQIEFYPPILNFSYYTIYKVSDAAFGMIGQGIGDKENCYFEREK